MSSNTVAITLEARVASDLMTSNPEAVFDTTTLREAAELLVRFSAVPVVDSQRRVVGVLSRTDLARNVKDDRPAAELHIPVDDERPSGLDYHPTPRVATAMNRAFVSVAPSATAQQVIQQMVDRAIGRVFVVDDERRLVGVISSTDILMSLRC